MKIGIFDSGIGGLTVLEQALSLLPDEDYIYYADSQHVPYGEKTKAQVHQYVVTALNFFASQNVKAVVIACNTATSAATPALRQRYPFPVVGIEPAVKPAITHCRESHRRVLVLATALTLKEDKYSQLIAHWDGEHIVDGIPLPGLVTFAENNQFDADLVLPYLVAQLSPFPLTTYGTVVLGCTHFPFFRHLLRELLPSDTAIIDGSTGTVNQLGNILAKQKQLGQGTGRVDYYVSGHKVVDPNALRQYEKLLTRLASD